MVYKNGFWRFITAKGGIYGKKYDDVKEFIGESILVCNNGKWDFVSTVGN